MVPAYDRPVRELMKGFIATLTPNVAFARADAVRWFKLRYPKVRRASVERMVETMTVNARCRQGDRQPRPGRDLDVFFKLGISRYRLWDPARDPAPVYRARWLGAASGPPASARELERGAPPPGDAHGLPLPAERDFRDWLALNLGRIERGLTLYREPRTHRDGPRTDRDGRSAAGAADRGGRRTTPAAGRMPGAFAGVEYPTDSGPIDILAAGADGALVAIELKREEIGDAALGQLLRYMGWVEANLAGRRKVRGILVGHALRPGIRRAARRSGIRIVTYRVALKFADAA